MAEHNELGKNGENLAVNFLEGKGYQIIARNWRCGSNELDIVALDGDTLVFVEVKTRHSDYVDPRTSMSKSKIRNFARAVTMYVKKMNIMSDFRLDVVIIVTNGGADNKSFYFEHYEDAILPTDF